MKKLIFFIAFICITTTTISQINEIGIIAGGSNYIGDIGTHVAKTLWCLNNFHKGELIKGNKGKYLGQLYVEANKRISENEDLKKEVSKLLQELEERKPEITKQWADTREWSLDEFKLIYRDLGINLTNTILKVKKILYDL